MISDYVTLHTWDIEPLSHFMDLAQSKLVEADMRGEIEKPDDRG